jgi:hypothetical protein
MLLRKLTLAVVAAAAVLPAFSAGAQYYDPYRGPPPYGYDRPGYDDRPRYDYDRPRYDYDRPYRARRFGDMCVTSRGDCPTRPSPIASPCRCYIDGFGEKRGAVQ